MTMQEKEKILRAHMARHNNRALPPELVDEASTPGHPLHDYFEWDDGKAGHQHRLHQARQFISSVRIVVKHGPKQEEVKVPLAISPIEDRQNGGGYEHFELEPKAPSAFKEEAADALRNWLHRWGDYVGSAPDLALLRNLASRLSQEAHDEAP